MNKLLKKIKEYKPSKYMCYLYFFIPIFVCCITGLDKEADIWFLLNHGEYVLENGFPLIEPFSMHQGFSFIMQQWLSAVIFYIGHSLLGQYGLRLILLIVNCLMLFFTYKLCMVITNNKFRLSVVWTCISQTLLLIFFIPRPWIFTFLNLIIVLYIMELYYKENKSKGLYFLPLISLLQINFQASMWFMIFLFILPYLVCLFIDKIKKKENKKIYKLLLIIIFMFIVGLINPYGIDNMLYVFTSYGNEYINKMIVEMQPAAFTLGNTVHEMYGRITFILMFIIVMIYIYYKKGKLELRHLFLLLGVSLLALMHIRSLGLFMIGVIPFISAYISPSFKELTKEEKKVKLVGKEKRQYILVIVFLIVYLLVFIFNFNTSFTAKTKKGIDKILETSNKKDVVLYTNYTNGSYAEYRGLKPYIDTRAEVYIKSFNKKEDIMKEYYLVSKGYIKYEEFVDKYKFTHMLIMKKEYIYKEAVKDEDYKVIFKDKKYVVLERKNIM